MNRTSVCDLESRCFATKLNPRKSVHSIPPPLLLPEAGINVTLSMMTHSPPENTGPEVGWRVGRRGFETTRSRHRLPRPVCSQALRGRMEPLARNRRKGFLRLQIGNCQLMKLL